MDAKFEQQVLKAVVPHLDWGRAEWFAHSLFVEGIMPDQARVILEDLQKLHPKILLSQSGSYQTDYVFSYDFV